VVVVDKPSGWTSHDVVARCRRIYGQRRVGHSGTLDPGATGVLLVGLGRATRLLRFLTALPKRYTAELVLGVGTSTLDDSGDVVARADAGAVTGDEVRAAAAALTGPILQVPPMVSAVRVGGRRLHALARQGLEVERAARPVTVHSFVVTPTPEPAVWQMAVTCSSGTYVRVLAADLGSAVGVPAHLRQLRRVAVGSLGEDRARSLEAVEADPAAAVVAPADALADYPAVTVDAEAAQAVTHGRPLPGGDEPTRRTPLVHGDEGAVGVEHPPWRVLDPDGSLIAVYERGPSGGLVAAVVLSA